MFYGCVNSIEFPAEWERIITVTKDILLKSRIYFQYEQNYREWPLWWWIENTSDKG